MAFDNNKVGVNINSYSLLKNMGYTKAPVPTDKTSVEAQNTVFNIDQTDIKMKIKVPHFEADLYDKTPQDPLSVTDFKNMDINVKNGLVQINDKDLTFTVTNLLKEETKNIVRNVDIDFIPGNQIKAQVKGKKFLNFNLTVQGIAHPNPINNVIRFTPDKININGIPVKRVMDFFGLEIGELIKVGNKKGSIFTSGDSIYFSPHKLVSSPKIEGNVTGLKTGVGTLAVMIGEDNIDTFKPKPVYGQNNYLTVRGGNVDFSGFNLLNTDLSLMDGTPENDFDIINDPSKKVISEGQVTIPAEFIATALSKKAGGGSMKDMTFNMPNGVGKLKAKMWGVLPVSLDLKFGNSSNGVLKVTPDKGKILGFIPLPDSILRNALVKETQGKVEGEGVTIDLDSLADLKTTPLKNVRTENGKLILNI